MQQTSLKELMSYSIDEDDQHMLLHFKHASDDGTRLSIQTVDIDVL